jgi:hypothetical protein
MRHGIESGEGASGEEQEMMMGRSGGGGTVSGGGRTVAVECGSSGSFFHDHVSVRAAHTE